MMFEIINVIGDRFVKAIEKATKISDLIDLSSWSQRFTADNIGNTAFGFESNCE